MGDLWLGWLIAIIAGCAFAYASFATVFTAKGRRAFWRKGKLIGGLSLWLSGALLAYFMLSVAATPMLDARGIKLPLIWWPLVASGFFLWLSFKLGAAD
jgi:hypothetical protein